jgi:hypothetical protein
MWSAAFVPDAGVLWAPVMDDVRRARARLASSGAVTATQFQLPAPTTSGITGNIQINLRLTSFFIVPPSDLVDVPAEIA